MTPGERHEQNRRHVAYREDPKKNLVEIYESESEIGAKAMYRKGGADYHTLRYVRWFEERAVQPDDTPRDCDECSVPKEICISAILNERCSKGV